MNVFICQFKQLGEEETSKKITLPAKVLADYPKSLPKIHLKSKTIKPPSVKKQFHQPLANVNALNCHHVFITMDIDKCMGSETSVVEVKFLYA